MIVDVIFVLHFIIIIIIIIISCEYDSFGPPCCQSPTASVTSFSQGYFSSVGVSYWTM